MPATRTAKRDTTANRSSEELDTFASEFSTLVEQIPPSRDESPSSWLGRLPKEVYRYYWRGASTFGDKARTKGERRGRLYLIHTVLVMMWMSWGKEAARHRFQNYAQKGVKRAASLIMLESYKRGGVLAHYEAPSWFFQPVGEWSVSLHSSSIVHDNVADRELRSSLRKHRVVDTDVSALSTLRSSGAVPPMHTLFV